MSYLDGNPNGGVGPSDPASFTPRPQPKFKGPGIFALGNNRDKATAEMGAYGIDLSQGNNYGQFAADSRGPGLGAQLGAMDMYRDAAMGNRPSVAGLQTQQGLQALGGGAARARMQAGGGNAASQLQGINAASAGQSAQMAQAGGLGRLAEQGQAQAGYAGLGTQLVNQGLQYDALSTQAQMANAEDQMKMYLGQRGLDQQKQAMNRAWAMQLAQGVVGATGGAMSAASTIAQSDRDQQPGAQ